MLSSFGRFFCKNCVTAYGYALPRESECACPAAGALSVLVLRPSVRADPSARCSKCPFSPLKQSFKQFIGKRRSR